MLPIYLCLCDLMTSICILGLKVWFEFVRSITDIAGGSGGIFIVNSMSCGTMVVKSANQVFQEVYALLFGMIMD
jgi:hypothetical protein